MQHALGPGALRRIRLFPCRRRASTSAPEPRAPYRHTGPRPQPPVLAGAPEHAARCRSARPPSSCSTLTTVSCAACGPHARRWQITRLGCVDGCRHAGGADGWQAHRGQASHRGAPAPGAAPGATPDRTWPAAGGALRLAEAPALSAAQVYGLRPAHEPRSRRRRGVPETAAQEGHRRGGREPCHAAAGAVAALGLREAQRPSSARRPPNPCLPSPAACSASSGACLAW